MGEYGELYAEGRARVIDLVAGLGPDRAATSVVTCPRWTVKDVLAHVAGVAADIIEGRLDGVASDPWTAAQVDARRDKSVAEIADEWRQTGPQIDGMVDSFGRTGAQLLYDLTTHEHDIRLALGAPGARDARVIDVILGFGLDGLDATLRQRGAGPIRVVADGTTRVVGGDGDPAITLTTSRFELVRALTGRRSERQLEQLGWSGDPSPYLPMLLAPLFRPARGFVNE